MSSALRLKTWHWVLSVCREARMVGASFCSSRLLCFTEARAGARNTGRISRQLAASERKC